MQGGGPRGGTRGACAEWRLLSRGRTPLSHLPDKHHENSAAHTVIAAPAAGRVSTSPFPRGESESESEISPPPSSLRPPPAAAPAPAAPARDTLRGRLTARRPRPGRPSAPCAPPSAPSVRSVLRAPLPGSCGSPAPGPPPPSASPPPGSPPALAALRVAGRAAASLPPGGRAPRLWDGRGGRAGRLRAVAGRPCHLSGTRGDDTANKARAGGCCQADLRSGVCPRAPAGKSAHPHLAEGSRRKGGGRCRLRESHGPRGRSSRFCPPISSV